MKICNPAKAYLGISILFILIGFTTKSIPVYGLLLKSLFVLLWMYVLSFLCKKKMKELAWAFVLLPFIMMGSSIMYGIVRTSYIEGLPQLGSIVSTVAQLAHSPIPPVNPVPIDPVGVFSPDTWNPKTWIERVTPPPGPPPGPPPPPGVRINSLQDIPPSNNPPKHIDNIEGAYTYGRGCFIDSNCSAKKGWTSENDIGYFCANIPFPGKGDESKSVCTYNTNRDIKVDNGYHCLVDEQCKSGYCGMYYVCQDRSKRRLTDREPFDEEPMNIEWLNQSYTWDRNTMYSRGPFRKKCYLDEDCNVFHQDWVKGRYNKFFCSPSLDKCMYTPSTKKGENGKYCLYNSNCKSGYCELGLVKTGLHEVNRCSPNPFNSSVNLSTQSTQQMVEVKQPPPPPPVQIVPVLRKSVKKDIFGRPCSKNDDCTSDNNGNSVNGYYCSNINYPTQSDPRTDVCIYSINRDSKSKGDIGYYCLSDSNCKSGFCGVNYSCADRSKIKTTIPSPVNYPPIDIGVIKSKSVYKKPCYIDDDCVSSPGEQVEKGFFCHPENKTCMYTASTNKGINGTYCLEDNNCNSGFCDKGDRPNSCRDEYYRTHKYVSR